TGDVPDSSGLQLSGCHAGEGQPDQPGEGWNAALGVGAAICLLRESRADCGGCCDLHAVVFSEYFPAYIAELCSCRASDLDHLCGAEAGVCAGVLRFWFGRLQLSGAGPASGDWHRPLACQDGNILAMVTSFPLRPIAMGVVQGHIYWIHACSRKGIRIKKPATLLPVFFVSVLLQIRSSPVDPAGTVHAEVAVG